MFPDHLPSLLYLHTIVTIHASALTSHSYHPSPLFYQHSTVTTHPFASPTIHADHGPYATGWHRQRHRMRKRSTISLKRSTKRLLARSRKGRSVAKLHWNCFKGNTNQGNFWVTGWSAYWLFWARWYHFGLNWLLVSKAFHGNYVHILVNITTSVLLLLHYCNYVIWLRVNGIGLWYCQPWWTVENPDTRRLSPQISRHPPSAQWTSVRSGEAQWVSLGQPPHLQWRQTGVRPDPYIVFHLLQHHAPWGKRGPARRHLHPFPSRRQSVQSSAPPRTHENHRGTHHWAAADDCILLSHTEEALPHIVIHFSGAAKNFGITISLKKNEVLYQPPPWEANSPHHINIDSTNLTKVEHLTYLDSVISKDATVSKVLDNCLSQSMAESLAPPLHRDPGIQNRCHSQPPVWCRDLGSWAVLEATWAVSQCCLRFILGIKWQGYMSNEEVLKTASLPRTMSILLQVQLHWAGQVTRMEDIRMPKAVFFSELWEGKRDQESVTKISWRDSLQRQESITSHGSRRPQTKAVHARQ